MMLEWNRSRLVTMVASKAVPAAAMANRLLRPSAEGLLRTSLALSALHHVMASSLSSIDVKDLASHKRRTIEVEHRLYNVRYLPHPSHWMERRKRLMGL